MLGAFATAVHQKRGATGSEHDLMVESGANGAASGSHWIECDPRELRENFDRSPFALRHNIAGHPLFRMERLLQLARFLEPRPDEYWVDVGVSHIDQRWDQTTHPSSSLTEVIDNLAQLDAWIVLRKAELDAEYRLLLDECMVELRQLMGGTWGRRTCRQNSIIFVTSPNRLSAYHIDRECNFILQIQGEKTIYVFDPNDREVLPEEEIELFWTVDNNAARYRPALQHRAHAFRLRPGDGVHVPVNAPHWAQNDDNVSVTLSVNFQFSDVERANNYRANYYLRKIGLNPSPPGRRPFRDNLKSWSFGGALGLWGLLKRTPVFAKRAAARRY